MRTYSTTILVLLCCGTSLAFWPFLYWPKICKTRPVIETQTCNRSNEIFLADGPTCQETCMWYRVPCEPKQTTKPVKGCYCKPGFIRLSEQSDCVPIETPDCQRLIPSVESCESRFEIYIEGGSPCQTNCATYGQECSLPNDESLKACYCREGLSRDSERGECVPTYSLTCRTQFP